MADPIIINLDPGKVFEPLLSRIRNQRPLMKKLSELLIDTVKENFAQQGRPQNWLQLARATIKDRERKGYWPGKILQRKGGGSGLLGSIASGYDDESAWVSTNKIYAAIHQFGGTISQGARSSLHAPNRYQRSSSRHRKGQFKKGTSEAHGFLYRARTITIPARPFMVLPEEDLLQMTKTAEDYITAP